MGDARSSTPTGRGRAASPTRPAAPATPRPPALFVARPRLDAFLSTVPDFPVTLVVAPAGSGKTAAAAAWAEHAGRAGTEVVWIPATDVKQLADQVSRSGTTSPAPVLVVDDAHLLPFDGVQLLGRVLGEDPPSVRLLLISRRDLDFVPVALALGGQARSLRVDDLRFTNEEAAELVRAHYPGAGPQDVAAVLDQSAGWAAAVVLASRALLTASDAADVRAALTATSQPALDYLLHEVVESLPPELTQVLLTTCQQDHVTSEEAVLLSGVPSAPTLLAGAAAAGLLVTSYRDADGLRPRGWRYHPLLLDLLRQRTSPTGPDWTRVVEAHQRATAYYVDRRDAERAVVHARLTGDLDLQVRVLGEFSAELITRGRVRVVADAVAEIPAEIRTLHPELLVLQATVLRAQGRVDAAKVAADRALAVEARSLARGVSRETEAQLAALGLWQARFGWRDPAPAITRAERVLGCRHGAGDEVSAHDIAGISPLSAVWLILELASYQTWLGEHDLATIHVQDAAMYSHQVDLPALERVVLSHRAVLEMIADAHQSATESAEASLALWRLGPARPDLPSARAHLVLAWGRLHELRIADAEEALAAFDAVPRAHVDPLVLVYGRLLRACLLIARGDVEAARRLLDTRGEVPERLAPFLERNSHLVRVVSALAMGDVPGLEAEAQRLRARGLTTAAVLAEALAIGIGGDEQRAVRMLDGLLPTGPDTPPIVALGVAVGRTAFLHRLGTPSALARARVLVPDLLGRAAPQRLLWTLSLGKLISPGFVDLLAAHAYAPGGHPFAPEAVAALRGLPRPYPGFTSRSPVGARPDQGAPSGATADDRPLLTPRELEVLEQLALGGGNADLARSLFVSENTVKTHLASIYRKLEVDRRVDALRVARARGLL